MFGLIFQQGSGFAHAESAGQSTKNAYKHIDILPDLPFIENYSAKEFQSHNQVFSMLEDQRGMMFFGNGDGWLEFDGARFRHTSTTSGVYAMGLDQHGVVYIGLRHDFGRLLPDGRGKLVFESLTARMSETERKFGAVLMIRATSQGLYFNTNKDSLFMWADERFEKIKIDAGMNISQIGDDVFAYNNSGIYVLQGARPVALPQTQPLTNKNEILLVLPYQEQQLLVVTQSKGLFLYSLGPKRSDGAIDLDRLSEFAGQRVRVLETPVADFLRQNELHRGVRLASGDYAFSTLRGGLVVMAPDGRCLYVIDESNGLIDNYVLDLYQDKKRNLWVATNNGMSYVELSQWHLRSNHQELGSNGPSVIKFCLGRHVWARAQLRRPPRSSDPQGRKRPDLDQLLYWHKHPNT